MVISFEEYKKIYAETHKLGMELGISDDEIMIIYFEDVFGDEEKYSKEDLINKKAELVNFASRLIENISDLDGLEHIYLDFYFIIGLLKKIRDSGELIDDMEKKFIHKVLESLESILQNKGFEYFFEVNIRNLIARTEYINDTGYRPTDEELSYQATLFWRHHKDVVQIGTIYPSFVIRWFQEYKKMYILSDRKYKYEKFYYSLLQMAILKSKELNRFDLLSEYIIEREKNITRRTTNIFKKLFRKIFLENILGYGEKLENIVKSMLVFCILMVFVYMNTELEGMPSCGVVDRVVASVYMFFTTSFTIGYGDITPKTTFARMAVMLNQVGGFFLSGSLVALYLRKWFRD